MWDIAPQAHSRVSNINFDIWISASNTFDLNPKWQRTLPSIGNFSWDMHMVPPNPNIKAVI
jgi:hypothetical protein